MTSATAIAAGVPSRADFYESGCQVGGSQSEYHVLMRERGHSVADVKNRYLGEYAGFVVQVDCRPETKRASASYGLVFRRSSDRRAQYRLVVGTSGVYRVGKVASGDYILPVGRLAATKRTGVHAGV